MMRQGQRRWWGACVVFESEGGCSERFLSDCVRLYLPVSNIQATPFGFRACIPAARYRQLRPLARVHRCRLRIRERRGLWFRLRWLMRHTGVAFGVLTVVLLTVLAPSLVWNIEYYGVAAQERQQLSDRLFECGIYQGCFATDAALRAAAQQILIDTDKYADLSLNYTKGRLTVEARTVVPPPVMFLPQEEAIVANEAGVVRSVQVYSGVAAVEPGQTVEKGEVLVQSAWLDQEGMLQPAPCRARVMAYVEQSYTTACPLIQDTQTVTGTSVDSLALCIGPWRIWLKKGSDPEAVPSRQGVRLLGMTLPCTIYRTHSVQRSPQMLCFTVEQAKQRCMETLNNMLYQQFSEVEVLSRDYNFDVQSDVVYCSMQLRAYADIAGENAAIDS